jgi:hypothetical protein
MARSSKRSALRINKAHIACIGQADLGGLLDNGGRSVPVAFLWRRAAVASSRRTEMKSLLIAMRTVFLVLGAGLILVAL